MWKVVFGFKKETAYRTLFGIPYLPIGSLKS